MSADIPQWAKERAKLLLNEMAVKLDMPFCYMADGAAVLAFAAYVAAHEEPPVDPLLIEAREVCASRLDAIGKASAAHSYVDGTWDDGELIQSTLAGIRRGIELAKTGGDQ